MVTRHKQIGETEHTTFVDDVPPISESRLFYYKVRAEDTAGNIKGARKIIRRVPTNTEDD
jgi:hypothetical protein